MSSTYNKLSIESANILSDLYKSETGAILITGPGTSFRWEALFKLVENNFVEKLTKTNAYQITPLGIYVHGLINEKTKEVLNDKHQR